MPWLSDGSSLPSQGVLTLWLLDSFLCRCTASTSLLLLHKTLLPESLFTAVCLLPGGISLGVGKRRQNSCFLKSLFPRVLDWEVLGAWLVGCLAF